MRDCIYVIEIMFLTWHDAVVIVYYHVLVGKLTVGRSGRGNMNLEGLRTLAVANSDTS
jgi:hypothetical protein